jgi:hypothetical protein
LFIELDAVIRLEPLVSQPAITAIDVRECVSTKPHMTNRVKEWYGKAVELGDKLEKSASPLYESDDHDESYLLSASCIQRDMRIDNVLASR